jgi:hypothetical protein
MKHKSKRSSSRKPGVPYGYIEGNIENQLKLVRRDMRILIGSEPNINNVSKYQYEAYTTDTQHVLNSNRVESYSRFPRNISEWIKMDPKLKGMITKWIKESPIKEAKYVLIHLKSKGIL